MIELFDKVYTVELFLYRRVCMVVHVGLIRCCFTPGTLRLSIVIEKSNLAYAAHLSDLFIVKYVLWKKKQSSYDLQYV